VADGNGVDDGLHVGEEAVNSADREPGFGGNAPASIAANRRQPAQDRSLRTVARILDAASSLLTQMPLEDVTTRESMRGWLDMTRVGRMRILYTARETGQQASQPKPGTGRNLRY
jgi:hypothetical protein